MVLKATGRGTKHGRSAVVIALDGTRKKSFRVVGNIPELYHGMFIQMELDEADNVLDYELTLDERNITALERANVNPDEYEAVLERHLILKSDGIGWNTARLSLEEIYSVLPFGEADRVHKEVVDDAKEPTRVDAINRKIIQNARNKRKISYGIEEFLGYFSAVEQEGAYQQLMVTLKMMCLQAERYGLKNGTVWDSEMKKKEDFIRNDIQSRKKLEYELLTEEEVQNFFNSVKDKGLEEEQLRTLWGLRTSLPCVITGGAGVGKTTVIQQVRIQRERNH